MIKDTTDWIAKEKRDMFLRIAISTLINKPDTTLESVYALAKDMVETVFKEYPDKTNGTAEIINETIDYGN
jgi:hypothetical protein